MNEGFLISPPVEVETTAAPAYASAPLPTAAQGLRELATRAPHGGVSRAHVLFGLSVGQRAMQHRFLDALRAVAARDPDAVHELFAPFVPERPTLEHVSFARHAARTESNVFVRRQLARVLVRIGNEFDADLVDEPGMSLSDRVEWNAARIVQMTKPLVPERVIQLASEHLADQLTQEQASSSASGALDLLWFSNHARASEHVLALAERFERHREWLLRALAFASLDRARVTFDRFFVRRGEDPESIRAQEQERWPAVAEWLADWRLFCKRRQRVMLDRERPSSTVFEIAKLLRPVSRRMWIEVDVHGSTMDVIVYAAARRFRRTVDLTESARAVLDTLIASFNGIARELGSAQRIALLGAVEDGVDVAAGRAEELVSSLSGRPS